jgi:hypothetical protein
MLCERATMSRQTYITYNLYYMEGELLLLFFFFKFLLIRGNTINECWCLKIVLHDKICYRNIGFWMSLFCD